MAVRNRAHYVQWFSSRPVRDTRTREAMLDELNELWQGRQSWRPNVDVCESEDAALVTIELPGVQQKDIELTYENGQLIVRGVREPRTLHEACSCQRIEIQYGPFERVIPIFCRIQHDGNITATYRDGILEVRLPKVRRAEPESVRVEIG